MTLYQVQLFDAYRISHSLPSQHYGVLWTLLPCVCMHSRVECLVCLSVCQFVHHFLACLCVQDILKNSFIHSTGRNKLPEIMVIEYLAYKLLS